MSHREPKYLAPIVQEIWRLMADGNDGLLSQEGWDRLDELKFQRRKEIRDAVPSPQCCEEARRYPVVRYHVLNWEIPSHEPRWFIMRYDSAFEHVDPIRSSERPAPKFCPFCAAPIPQMRRKANPPKDMRTELAGSDHCGTCFEGPECLCLPPEAAFEPVV